MVTDEIKFVFYNGWLNSMIDGRLKRYKLRMWCEVVEMGWYVDGCWVGSLYLTSVMFGKGATDKCSRNTENFIH